MRGSQSPLDREIEASAAPKLGRMSRSPHSAARMVAETILSVTPNLTAEVGVTKQSASVEL